MRRAALAAVRPDLGFMVRPAAITVGSPTYDARYCLAVTSTPATIITPSNAMGFDNIRKGASAADDSYAQGDVAARFARQLHLSVSGHPLMWYRSYGYAASCPHDLICWLRSYYLNKTGPGATGEAKRRALRSLLLAHVRDTVTHFTKSYPGTFTDWDVVNEPLQDGSGPPQLRRSFPLGDGGLSRGALPERGQLCRRPAELHP